MLKYTIITLLTFIVYSCSSSTSTQNAEEISDEIKETEQVTDMIKSDSLKMDSMRKAVGLD